MRNLWIIAFLFILGCASHSKDLNTDTGTLAEGDRLLEDDFYEEARKQYYRIKTEFPESRLQVEADLRIADSYFEEESFPAAADSYQEFIKTYPGRPEIPYAIYRMGMSYLEQMPSNPLRDTRSTKKAADTFVRLLIDYPNSEYANEASKYVERAHDQLARKIYRIARFYEKKDRYEAAARRYGSLVELYGDHSLAEESLARQIRMLRMAEETERADQLTLKFQQKFPGSKFMSMIKP